ncbi:MAG: cytochrome c biogenesis protein CcdA [Lachnospiraceae bacterium]|nr:cytochrome c biogenesis protein CcdA [Lachnospiraceae bacterium]
MQYILSFLEGIITFISPCILPMIPIYISYFASGEENKKKTVANALGFVVGFTIVFVSLGAFAGILGGFLIKYKLVVNIITGLIVVIFGLNFMGVLKIGFLNKTKKADVEIKGSGLGASILFGIVFSIGWTPCVGAFLGSALMLASQQGTVIKGIIMLILYSVGLGIPFVISAMLIDRLKGLFDAIKKNYRIINLVSGGLLVVTGIMMMTGVFGYVVSLFS